MLSELRIMVLEDHGFQRRMALRLLEDIGVPAENLIGMADAESALASLSQDSRQPDLVLVDLDMPGMDGIEFLGHLAQRHLAGHVALVSALDAALLHSVQTMASAYGLHILGVVEKPLTTEKLLGMLAARSVQRATAEPEMHVHIDEDELREGVARGAMHAWFQPQVELLNGKPVGVEALARWHRGAQVVEPTQFVPVLERLGLTRALADTILDQACAWKRRWEAEHGMRLNVSINVCTHDLGDPGIADHFLQIVNRHGVAPEDVVLEITESALLADLARGLSVLARLRLKGFGLSIDDFGVGYSSLAQLSHIPFTELKIDRSFVAGLTTQPRKRAVVEASLDLATKLQLVVVAEGVETQEEWQLLAELGCGLAQGFLIAPPVPGEDLARALSAWRHPE